MPQLTVMSPNLLYRTLSTLILLQKEAASKSNTALKFSPFLGDLRIYRSELKTFNSPSVACHIKPGLVTFRWN